MFEVITTESCLTGKSESVYIFYSCKLNYKIVLLSALRATLTLLWYALNVPNVSIVICKPLSHNECSCALPLFYCARKVSVNHS